MITEIERGIKERIKGKVLYREPMSRHTSFRIGGPADIWIEPADTDDLKSCIQLGRDSDTPLLIIGGGTNLLVRDEGVRGIVVDMGSRALKDIRRDGCTVTAASAVALREVVDFCTAEGLAGLEFLAGIPGTAGGAVATNAGVRHYGDIKEWHSTGALVEEIKIMEYAGNIRLVGREKLYFRYKALDIADSVILEVKFLLTHAARDSVLRECQRFLQRKKATQELSAPSAGCIFKNPPGVGESAGELIDRCGLKGRKIGGAEISKKHANFIINTGKARAGDVMELMAEAVGKVKDKFGVELVPEIRIV